jgi:glycosyltransferase involved in cell wall biosynthesis
MAARIVQLLKDGVLRQRMGLAALQRARDFFTVDRMVEGTAAVYESLSAGQVNEETRREPPPASTLRP